jgi:hypothetical protein
MDEYKIDEYFLYNSFKNDGENFKQLIHRFFGSQASNVMRDVQIKISSNKLTNNDFYNIYSRYVKPPNENEKQQIFNKPII